MRLPFLQVEAALLGPQGQVAAGMLRATPQQLVGYVTFMRAYVLGHCGDEEVTGLVQGPSAARALAIAAGWTGDPEEFVTALEDPAVRLLERVPGGVLVRGMEPYEAARKKSEASKARMRKSRDAKRLRATTPHKTETYTKTEKKTQTDPSPPKFPQGAREPREGDPCEEHNPPRTTTNAPQVAPASFAPESPKPRPGEWTLHVAIQAVYELVRQKQRYPWDPQREQKALESLWGLCAAEGIREPQAQVQEVAKRFGRALACADEPVGKPPFGRRASTLAELAKPACWAANATPFEFQEEWVEGGLRKMRPRRLEVWPHAKWRAAA